jgi:hypothetical protein
VEITSTIHIATPLLSCDATKRLILRSPCSPKDASDALQRIEKQLLLLHEKISGIAHRVETTEVSGSQRALRAPIPTHQLDAFSPPSQDGSQRRMYTNGASSLDSPQTAGAQRQSLGEVDVPRPNLLTFCCPAFLCVLQQWDSWDDSEAFYDDQLAAGEELFKDTRASQLRNVDLSRKTTLYLQQNFVENYLRWLPICELQDCVRHVNQAYACNFDPSDPSSCFAMLVFAIGRVADGSTESYHQELPGLDYFARGNMMLDTLSVNPSCMTRMQCRLLQTAYFELSSYPLLAWNSICQVSRDCMHVLSSSQPRKSDRQQRDILQRIFWACSVTLQ